MKRKFDEFTWGVIYALPIFVYLFSAFRLGTFPNFAECVAPFRFEPINGILNDCFALFSSDNFITSGLLTYASYLVGATLCHFVVDVLLWLPRFFMQFSDYEWELKHDKKR